MAEAIIEALVAVLGGAFVSYGVEKVLNQYLRIPLIVRTKWLRHKGRAHEYEGKHEISNYWRDLLGHDYGLSDGAEKSIKEHHLVTFKDVIVTDFVPRAPGFYYSKSLWDDPKEAPISLGVIRIIPKMIVDPKRLLAIHSPLEFEAHADIEKGIPIVVSREVHKALSDKLDDFGSIHVDKITTIMSDLGAYRDYLRSAGMPSTFPVVKDRKYIRGIGDPIPIMGNAWTVYRTPKKTNLVNFRFWTGVDYYKKSLEEAKRVLEKLVPKNGWSLTDFDERIPHFMNAPLRLSEVWKYFA